MVAELPRAQRRPVLVREGRLQLGDVQLALEVADQLVDARGTQLQGNQADDHRRRGLGMPVLLFVVVIVFLSIKCEVAYLGTQGVRVMNTPSKKKHPDSIVVKYERYVVYLSQPSNSRSYHASPLSTAMCSNLLFVALVIGLAHRSFVAFVFLGELHHLGEVAPQLLQVRGFPKPDSIIS